MNYSDLKEKYSKLQGWVEDLHLLPPDDILVKFYELRDQLDNLCFHTDAVLTFQTFEHCVAGMGLRDCEEGDTRKRVLFVSASHY